MDYTAFYSVHERNISGHVIRMILNNDLTGLSYNLALNYTIKTAK